MEDPNAFKLFITHVEGEGPFLRISGQVDKQALGIIENLFAKCRNDLDNGVGAVQPSAIVEGLVCAVKYKDGVYYRVKIISTNDIERGIIGVLFIDYGNKDFVSVHSVRLLEEQELLNIPPLAEIFYLWHIVNPGRWDEGILLKLQNLLCYAEYPAFVKGSLHTVPFIQILYRGHDLSTYLQHSLSLHMSVVEQPVMPMSREEAPVASCSTYNNPGEIACADGVPFLNNQNFPINPASAMRVNQKMNRQVGDLAIKAPRAVSLRPLSRQPFAPPANYPPSPKSVMSGSGTGSPTSVPSVSSVTSSPVRVKTIKSRLLETQGVYKVFVPYAEGPEMFAVQLVTETDELYSMMDKINSLPHQSLKEPPMIGSVCLGRMTLDRMVCRAIVMNICGSQCKLYFIDFGDTEMTSYYDIFDIPEEILKPHVFAMRFCLSGMKKIPKTQHTIDTFKKLVEDKVLTLRVMPPEGPPLIQYCELYVDNINVLDYLINNQTPRYTRMKLISVGDSTLALVSYVDSCGKFYIQLSSLINNLNFVMDAMKKHCETSIPLKEVSVGMACCALFPDDGKWYRALVIRINGSRISVFYVDYGNEQEVQLSDLRSITLDFTQLPALAMRCALKGFENKGDDQMLANQLEMLVLEKTFTVHVTGMLSEDTMLVTLTDDRVSPAINVGQVMSQLSKPKSEPKMQSPKHDPDTSNDRRRPPKVEEYKRPPPLLKPPTYRRKTRPSEAVTESAMGSQDVAGASSSTPFKEQPHSSRSAESGSKDQKMPKGGKTRHQRRQSRKKNVAGACGERVVRFPEFTGIKVTVNNNESTPPKEEIDENVRFTYNRRVRFTLNEDSSRRENINLDTASARDYNSRDNAYALENKTGCNSRDNASTSDYNSRDNASTSDYNSRDIASARDYKSRDNASARDYKSRDNASARDYNNRDNASKSDCNSRDTASARDNKSRDNASARDYKSRDNASTSDYNTRENTSGRDFNRDQNSRRDHNPRRDIRDRPPRNHDSSFESVTGYPKSLKPRGKFTPVKPKQLSNPQPLNKPFEPAPIELTAQHEVAVTYIISPVNFYSQILTFHSKFLEMMHKIPEVYRGVKPYSGPITEGDSVLAKFPDDGVLYRATVIAILPLGKFLVQYVDFGNRNPVESKDIWQLDGWLMDLPKMAVHCSLTGVTSKDGLWKDTTEIDKCFHAPRYQCVFLDNVEGVFHVSMYNNGVSVADTLIKKGLADASVVENAAAAVELKDEPVDWALVSNNKFVSKVTHVDSVAKFFIQINAEKMRLIEELLAKATLIPVAADNLLDRMPCAVKLEDRVYRANFVEHVDQSTVKLYLYDYGYYADINNQEVMLSPPEVACFYPQAEECGFHEEKTTMSLEQMKETILGKECIVHVNSVVDNRLLTTLYSLESGEWMLEGEGEAVSPLCPRAVFNHNFGIAFVAHCQTLTEVYLHKATDIDGIALMLDDLYKYYEEGSEAELLSDYQKGALCAAKSSDGNWYRATVASSKEDAVEVQYPDYGNFELIAKENIKKLSKQFHKPCARALLVSLGLNPLSDSALVTLKEWVADKEVQVTLSRQEQTGRWLANLHLDGDDLALKLINESLASPIPDSEEVPEGSTSVYVSHVDSPGQFWLQMPALVDLIEEVQAELQANAHTYPELEKRELGTICAAQYSADEQWYRAEILDADADITTVRFIDYGNADVLNNTPSSLKRLPEHLIAMPPSAVKASVNAVPTGTGEWSEAATELFAELLGDRIDPFQANIVLTGLTTYIDVFVGGKNVTDALVEKGHATKTDCSGDLPTCFASHVNSPAEFWIQLASSTNEFQIMESELAKADTFPELALKLDGVICAAKFNDDGCYYRAQIIVDGSEGTEVLFMDYGNASISNDLRVIPAELVSKPALARKCALQKPHDIKTWSRRAEEKFNEIAAEGATIFKVQFIASGDISVVELYLDGKSITETLVTLCEEKAVSPQAAPIQAEKYFTGRISYVESVNYFVAITKEQESMLTNVQDQLKNAADYENLSNLEVGTVCAALSATDNVWYRAKILQSTDAETLVEFIDYGNKEACTQLKQLPEELSAMEPLVKRFSLLDREMGSESLDKLQALAAADTCVDLMYLDRGKDPAVVQLFINGEDAFIVGKSNEIIENDDVPTADDDNEVDPSLSPKGMTNISNDYDDAILSMVGQDNGDHEEQPENNADAGEELNDSSASFITVISLSARHDTGYTSSADIEKSPISDIVTDDKSFLSPMQDYGADYTTSADIEKSPVTDDDCSFSPRQLDGADSEENPQIDDGGITATSADIEKSPISDIVTSDIEKSPISDIVTDDESFLTPMQDYGADYTSNADIEKSPVTDGDCFFSPRQLDGADSEEYPQIDDGGITATDLEGILIPLESVRAEDNVVSNNISAQSSSYKYVGPNIKNIETKLISSDVLQTKEDDLECRSAESRSAKTDSNEVTEEDKSQEAGNITDVTAEGYPKDIKEGEKSEVIKEEAATNADAIVTNVVTKEDDSAKKASTD